MVAFGVTIGIIWWTFCPNQHLSHLKNSYTAHSIYSVSISVFKLTLNHFSSRYFEPWKYVGPANLKVSLPLPLPLPHRPTPNGTVMVLCIFFTIFKPTFPLTPQTVATTQFSYFLPDYLSLKWYVQLFH